MKKLITLFLISVLFISCAEVLEYREQYKRELYGNKYKEIKRKEKIINKRIKDILLLLSLYSLSKSRNYNYNALLLTIPKNYSYIKYLNPIDDFNFHLLRHTVSTWLSSQVSLITARDILGYSDIKTTLRYSHGQIEQAKQGVAKIGAYFNDLLS